MSRFPLIEGVHELILDTRREARRRLAELASTFPNLPLPRTEEIPDGLSETCRDPPVCFRNGIPALAFHYWSKGGQPITSFLTPSGGLEPKEAREACSLSDQNRADRITPAVVRLGSKTCICVAGPKHGHSGGATQLWVESPRADLFLLPE